jgi:beta-lactamase regulating signal transducer with metallopeptidase domain
MSVLLDWFTGPNAESLCLALLHSLWQGAAWCAVLLVALRCIRSDRPEVRYAVALTCMYGLLFGACLTWSVLRQTTSSQAPGAVAHTSVSGEPMPSTGENREHHMSSVSVTGVSTSPVPFELSYLAPWLVSTWLIGACLCLLLSSRHVAAVRRFQAGRPIDDPEVNRLFNRLIATLGISRPVQLLSVDGLAVPGVVGVLRPAILVPSSLVTGLTPDQWEAILAHELAHIRRWDYLVNLSQLVIESVLFFNPAVWWLSRQVRLEREACCDAAAVAVTARPFQYATLLVSLAEGLQLKSDAGPLPALGFSRDEPCSLLERVQRIVTPGRRSELKIKRTKAFGFLALGILAVALLQIGTNLLVGAAASLLTDEERVAALAEVVNEMEALESRQKITIRGTVSFQTEGDQPAREDVTVVAKTRRGINGYTKVHTNTVNDNSEFDVTVPPGITYLQFSHPDFASTYVGPFGANVAPLASGAEVVLTRGIDVAVTVVDETGRPVPNARIGTIPLSPGGGGTGDHQAPTTGENGQALLTHVNPELEYSYTITAPGFQELSLPDQKLRADSPLRLQMFHARPAGGVIVNENGEGVAGATLKEIHRHRGSMSWSHRTPRTPVTATDANGRFLLTELLDGGTYDYLVECKGYGPTILPGVRPGDTALRARLGPAITVKGTVHGPIELLETLGTDYPISWSFLLPQPLSSPWDDHHMISDREPYDLREGVGYFTLPPMAAGELTVTVGNAFKKVQLTTSIEDLRFDLSETAAQSASAQPAKRLIRVSFTKDGKRVSPQGVLQIAAHQFGHYPSSHRDYPIVDGAVEVELTVPDQVRFDSEGMIGFWFSYHDVTRQVDDGEGPFEVTLPVQPAGAVKGIVFDNKGLPLADASVGVNYELEYRTPNGRSHHGSGYSSLTNGNGEFFLTPLPLGARCSIRVSYNDYYFVLDESEFRMRVRNALPSFTFKQGRTVDAMVRVVDSSGIPLAGQSVQLRSTRPLAPGWGNLEVTDPRGEYCFSQLNPELEGRYEVRLAVEEESESRPVPLKLSGETTVIRVE